MNKVETAQIMKLIQSQYRGYYRDENELRFALSVMEKLFAEWEYGLIEKGLFRFMTTDTKGFPPVAGQLITLAKEIRKEEWESKQRAMDQLPAPKVERVEMPEDVKEKMIRLKYNFLDVKKQEEQKC